MLVIDGCRIRSGGGILHAVKLMRSLSENEQDAVLYASVELYEALKQFSCSMNMKIEIVNSKSILTSLFWQRFRLPKILKKLDDCQLVTLDSGSISPARHKIVIHQDISIFMPRLWLLRGTLSSQVRNIILLLANIYTFWRSDLVIFQSEFSQKLVGKYIKTKSAIIPHGTEKWFVKSEVTKNENESILKIVCVSPIYPYKDYKTVFEACRLLERYYDIELVICGEIADKTEFKRLLRLKGKLARNAIVKFEGHLSKSDIEDRVNAADVMVFSSLSETFGITLLECMQSQTPVIASSFEVSQEILDNPHAIFLKSNAISLSNLIKRVKERSDFAKTIVMKQNIRVNDFSWSKSMTCFQMYLR